MGYMDLLRLLERRSEPFSTARAEREGPGQTGRLVRFLFLPGPDTESDLARVAPDRNLEVRPSPVRYRMSVVSLSEEFSLRSVASLRLVRDPFGPEGVAVGSEVS